MPYSLHNGRMAIEEIVDIIKQQITRWKPSIFQREFVLFHKGQIPTVCVYLHQGEVQQMGARKKIFHTYRSGDVLLIEETLKQQPLKRDIYVQQGSMVSLIDRTSLSVIAQSEN
jgi:hypothetical protein